jgi:hypothetical protein
MRNEVRAGKSPPAVQPTNRTIISVGKEDALGMIGFCEPNERQEHVTRGEQPAEHAEHELLSIAV